MTFGRLTFTWQACNVGHHRKSWAEHDNRPEHPLLEPDPDFHGWRPLTDAEAVEEDRRHRPTGDGPTQAAE